MNGRRQVLSTSDARREAVIPAAIACFGQTGYLGTPVAAIAAAAGISQAYVFKLYPAKVDLFVAALDACFVRILDALEQGAATAVDRSPAGLLEAMGGAYAGLIADRDVMRLQVHALAASDDQAIRAAYQRGLADITSCVTRRSGAAATAVQQFMARGQLCHLVAMLDLDAVDAVWARTLADGIRHPGFPLP